MFHGGLGDFSFSTNKRQKRKTNTLRYHLSVESKQRVHTNFSTNRNRGADIENKVWLSGRERRWNKLGDVD